MINAKNENNKPWELSICIYYLSSLHFKDQDNRTNNLLTNQRHVHCLLQATTFNNLSLFTTEIHYCRGCSNPTILWDANSSQIAITQQRFRGMVVATWSPNGWLLWCVLKDSFRALKALKPNLLSSDISLKSSWQSAVLLTNLLCKVDNEKKPLRTVAFL